MTEHVSAQANVYAHTSVSDVFCACRVYLARSHTRILPARYLHVLLLRVLALQDALCVYVLRAFACWLAFALFTEF